MTRKTIWSNAERLLIYDVEKSEKIKTLFKTPELKSQQKIYRKEKKS